MIKGKNIAGWILRFFVLLILFYVFYFGGSIFVAGKLPDIQPEPGLLPTNISLLLIGIVNTLMVMGLILSSRWSGWYLILRLAFAYFGAVTFVMQIETWYFLMDNTVTAKVLPYLFIMGLPVAFLYIPLAILISGKGRSINNSESNPASVIPFKQWVWKLIVIALAYVVLYWSAGYFIAWQNPELRTFYGSPGEILPFWEHTVNTLRSDPGLLPVQIFRAMLWTLCALPVIRGSKLNVWQTAILVGFFFSIPQNIGHIMENPLMPVASIRLSHLIETSSSTFVFGLIIVWLLNREHKSARDLFGIKP
jgi:hypothetical protein